MPYEMVVQRAFTERLPGGGVRVHEAGEHITDAAWIEALGPSDGDDEATATTKGAVRAAVVRLWVDDPASEPAKADAPEPVPASPAPQKSAPAGKPDAASKPPGDPAPAPSKT